MFTLKSLIAQLLSASAVATAAAMHLVLRVFGFEDAVINASMGLVDDLTLANGNA